MYFEQYFKMFFSDLFGSVNMGINFDSYDSIPVNTSGEDCPLSISNFDECDFASMLQENIQVSFLHMY